MPYHGLGSGIKRALSEWSEIDFIDDPEGCLFKAVVRRKAVFVEDIAYGSPESSPKSSPESSPEIGEAILNLVRNNARITTKDMGNALGISKRAVLKRIDNLKKQGLLRRVGPNKGGSWEVVE